MEYAAFDFTPLGGDAKFNSLVQFLRFVDSFKVGTVEHFMTKIANDVTKGLLYLHNKNIVHRDLKPNNILVSNQHYANIKDKKVLKEQININPITCTLIDFGESRSQLIQTKTMCHTSTNDVKRGTVAFMSPEQLPGPYQAAFVSIESLKKTDIWQLGMTFFCLLNPNLTYPYGLEYSRLRLDENISPETYIGNLMKCQTLPEMSTEYEFQRTVYWDRLMSAYKLSSKLEAQSRSSLEDIIAALNIEPALEVTNLRNSQASALEQFDESVACGSVVAHPTNDGTNCCTFLCLKIATKLLNNENLAKSEIATKSLSESIIEHYPSYINKYRTVENFYDPFEALQIMKKSDDKMSKFELYYELLPDGNIFHKNGMKNLVITLTKLSEKNFYGVYVVAWPTLYTAIYVTF